MEVVLRWRQRRPGADVVQLDQLDGLEAFWHSIFRTCPYFEPIAKSTKIVHEGVWITAYSYDTSTSWTDNRQQ